MTYSLLYSKVYFVELTLVYIKINICIDLNRSFNHVSYWLIFYVRKFPIKFIRAKSYLSLSATNACNSSPRKSVAKMAPLLSTIIV